MPARVDILAPLRAALEPLPFILAMWEGGATAWNRVDEWSDIDLQLDVEDGRVADAVAAVETTLSRCAPVNLR